MAKLEPLKKAQKKPLVKVQPGLSRDPQHFGDASTMGQPPRTAAGVKWNQPEPRKHPCLPTTAEAENWNRLEKSRLQANPRHWILRFYTARL